MVLTKVAFAALCCLIAHTLRCSATQEQLEASQTAVKKRTLRQEMLILSQILNINAFNGSDPKFDPESISVTTQKTTVVKIARQLRQLKTYIDGEKFIFKAKTDDDKVPEYKGVNRYLLVKGLLNSMALKFEYLKEVLLQVTSEAMDEIKEIMVRLDFAKEDEIIEDVSLNQLRVFYNLFYDVDSPIPNLRKLFRDYEDRLTTGELPKKHPLVAFYKDENDGKDLDKLDKDNAEMTVHASYGMIPLIHTKNVGQRTTDGKLVSVSIPVTLPETHRDGELANSNVEGDNRVASQESQLLTEVTEETEEHKEREGQVGGLPAQQMAGVREPNGPPALPVEQKDASRASPTPAAIPSPTPSGSPSLRSGATETTTPKASSAFDSFVSLLLVASAVFIF